MNRDELKSRIDELSDEEVWALGVPLGPSEDRLAAESPALQAELGAALSGELRGRPIEDVARALASSGRLRNAGPSQG